MAWVGSEDIILSEIGQTEKDLLNVLTYLWNLRNKKHTHRNREQIGGGGRVKEAKVFQRYKLPVRNKSWGCDVQRGVYS